ncbi:unnamed protein product [Echinostoma caproni]|uniref:DUF4201 domain-containing protein n=1 Tax=Echinostoma caproni TaxID=27848 RepID=A0A183ACI0_9TREM|nr:unnamed protein product [Echinostoma caproni]
MNEGEIAEHKANLEKLLAEIDALQATSDRLTKELSDLSVSFVDSSAAPLPKSTKCDEVSANVNKINDALNKERIEKRRRIVKIESDLSGCIPSSEMQFSRPSNPRLYKETLTAWDDANAQLQFTSSKLAKQRAMLRDLHSQQEQLTQDVKKTNAELDIANAQKTLLESQLEEMEKFHSARMAGLHEAIKQIKQLNDEIETSHEYTVATTAQVESLRLEREDKRVTLRDQINVSQQQLNNTEDRVIQAEAEIEQETPGCEALKQLMVKRTTFYEKLRQQQARTFIEVEEILHELSLDVKSLTQQINRKSVDIRSLSQTLSEAENKLAAKVSKNTSVLSADANELHEREKHIYITGCRLKTVRIENARLMWGIRNQEEIMRSVCSDWERILRKKSKVRRVVGELHSKGGVFDAKKLTCPAVCE